MESDVIGCVNRKKKLEQVNVINNDQTLILETYKQHCHESSAVLTLQQFFHYSRN